jgi:hypothetical protein
VIQNHPNRTVPDFRRKLVRGLAGHGSILSGVGASGKPGAVQQYGFGKILFKVAPTARGPAFLTVAVVEASKRGLTVSGVLLGIELRNGPMTMLTSYG